MGYEFEDREGFCEEWALDAAGKKAKFKLGGRVANIWATSRDGDENEAFAVCSQACREGWTIKTHGYLQANPKYPNGKPSYYVTSAEVLSTAPPRQDGGGSNGGGGSYREEWTAGRWAVSTALEHLRHKGQPFGQDEIAKLARQLFVMSKTIAEET